MSSVTIRYQLTEKGRKAAFLAGLSASAKQNATLADDHPRFTEALELATVNKRGEASVVFIPYSSSWECPHLLSVSAPEYDHAPTADELLDDAKKHREAVEEIKLKEADFKNNQHEERGTNYMVTIELESEFDDRDMTAPALKEAIERALDDLCHTIRVRIRATPAGSIPDMTFEELSDAYSADEEADNG